MPADGTFRNYLASMKKNFTITFLFHLLFLLLALFLVLFFQTVSARPLSGFTVSITPNPVRSMMRITVSGANANEVLLVEIYSVGGMVVYHGSMRATGTRTVKVFARPAASPGLYYYRVMRRKNSQVVGGKVIFQ